VLAGVNQLTPWTTGAKRHNIDTLPQTRVTPMRFRIPAVTLVAALLPTLAVAQGSTPVAEAFRDNASKEGKNLMAAADLMPADKYAFKPTPAQMTFGEIQDHLAQGNDYLCSSIGGMKAPTRTKVAPTDGKDAVVARLKETFAFCDKALAGLDDSKLSEQLPFFGGKTKSRAAVMTLTTGDWADHYSQEAIYLRLNGLLPPTAKKPAA
jgi:hypothetical protein